MTLIAIAAWLHYLGIMAMMAFLVLEHRLFRPQMSVDEARSLLRIDGLYGTIAGVQIGTGVWRMLLEKGSAYYMANPLFHAKIALFALVGILSLYPTMKFLRWRTGLRQGQAPQISARTAKTITLLIRLELLGLTVLPLLAVLIAHGAKL